MKVERKRHIGNDVVVIIFQEDDAEFDPTMLKTQFNRMLTLLGPMKTSNNGHALLRCLCGRAGRRGAESQT